MADLPDPLPDPPGPLQVLTFRQEPITKTDPQAWYERNLFWGCFTSAVAIIFGVITAMTKDIRWVLFGAWPFASIALWTALNFFVYRKFLTSIGSIVILVGICFLYALLNPEQMAPIAKETSLSQKDLQDTTHGAPSRFWESEPSKETTKSEPPKPKLEDKPPPKPESAVSPASPICSVVANVSADVVSRVYYRDTEKTGEQILNPTSQELFYEWKAVLSADRRANNVFLEIHHLNIDDRISITPASAILSDPQGKWHSGFPEPHRSKPDYFARTIKISDLSQFTSSLTIHIRRFLLRPLLSQTDLIKIQTIGAANCQARIAMDPLANSAEKLQARSRILLENVNRSNRALTPVPNRPDPGDLRGQEVEGTIEFRCKNDVCSEMNATRLEGRISKSPYEQAREQARNKLLALKRDLEGILCIEEPYEDPDPTKDIQMIKMCDEKKQLSADEMIRLKQIIEKHGFKLDVMTKHKK